MHVHPQKALFRCLIYPNITLFLNANTSLTTKQASL
uniref:Uncharacterized protein n=1 Tax=Rhizophora mucronata TaxID=61149 RepID=A0A2P2PES5_RHIMU